jgi:tetratricopeptide (TPR) repeat protein
VFRLQIIGCGALLFAATSRDGFAQSGRSFTDRPVPGMRQMDRHNPFSPGYVDMTPGGYARRQFNGLAYGAPPYRSYSGGTFFYGSGPVGYDYLMSEPYFNYGYYGPLDYGYAYAPLAPYPLAIPAESLFGLGPVLNMLGAAGAAASSPAPNVLVAPQPNPVEKLPGRPRASNPEAIARAARFLSAGDEHFAAQRYRDANARYRTATETAPDLVEAFFKQGQALVASGQFELAGKAFKRGLRLGDKWPQARFDLAELYGDNQVAKTAHLEAVAAAAEAAPHDGTLWLLAALQLHFDGQQQRAVPFFRRAAELLPGEELNLAAVLQPAAQ